MAGPIARRPAGLLDLLLTQQQGKQPTDLGDVVTPTLDIQPFYNQERLTTETAVLSNAAVGSVAIITIPAGESWQMLFLTTRGTFNAAAQTLRIGFRIASIAGGDIIDIGQTADITAVGAADTYSGQVMFQPGQIFSAGTRFLATTQQVGLAAGAAIAGSLNALYVRMET